MVSNNRTEMAVDEIENLPEGWKAKKLGEVFRTVTDYVANGSFASLKENVTYKSDEDFAVLIRLQDYSSNFKGNFVYVNERSYEFLKKSKLKSGDIIISNVGAAGTVFKVPPLDKPMTLGPNAILVRGDNDDYMYHWLRSSIGQQCLKNITTKTAQPKFNKTDFKSVVCLIPPLPEQRKIAAILTSIDDAITATQRIIDQTEVVKRGLMQQLLTKGIGHTTFKQTEIGEIPAEWDVVRIDDLAELVTSGSRGWSRYYSTHGALFIRSQDVGDTRLTAGERAYVQVPDSVEGQRTKVQYRDLLISITGNPGNVAMAPSDIGEAFVSQHVALVRLLRPELSPFLTYFLCSDMGQRQFDGNAYGQTRPGLNLKNIRELVVPVPSLEEQTQIVKILESVDSKLVAELASYENLLTIKRGLMQVLLMGKVRVNVDESSEVSV